MPLQTVVSSISHPGQKRSHNEDFVTHFEPDDIDELQESGRLYIVADGVGGESRGEVASRYAAQKVLYEYFRLPQMEIGERLSHLIRQAGNEIYQYAENGATHRRMATTMVAAVIKDDKLTVANVGDSRAYLIRNGIPEQLTKDHSLLGERVRDGTLTEEESLHANVKNRITRSLGGETNVRVDVHRDIPLQPGDQILLCSDGLTQYATRETLARLIRGKQPQEITESVVDFANQQGGSDNISVILIQLTESPTEYPTIVSHGDVPSPVDWDTMSTLPGKKGRGFLGRQRHLWVRIAAVGILAILTLSLLFVSKYAFPSLFGEQQESTALTMTSRMSIEQTIAEMGRTPSLGGDTQTEVPTDLVSGEETPEVAPTSPTETTPPAFGVGSTKVSPVDNMTLVYIPGGEFTMGSDENNKAYPDEYPKHNVYLDPYWIDQTEVTHSMFVKFLNSESSQPISVERYVELGKGNLGIEKRNGSYKVTSGYENIPIYFVTWEGAKKYCEWAGKRLPTEAEWEKAAKGGLEDGVFPWGEKQPVCERGAINGAMFSSCEQNSPIPVKMFVSNNYGIYDMAGNVWEWVYDWYSESYYQNSQKVNPRGPDSGEQKILRGGAWNTGERLLRTTNRGKDFPTETRDYFGFRCAQSVDGAK